MKIALALLATLFFATNVLAADSIAVGIRDGAATNHETSNYTELFADVYINQLVSIGASASYVMPNHNQIDSLKRTSSEPFTALFKLHAPTPLLRPYAGFGEAVEFHSKYSPTGSPVALVGVDLPLGPLFLSAEFRRPINDSLNYLNVGVGFSF